MSKAKQVRDYVAANPGITSREIAAALDMDPTAVSVALLDGYKQGKLSRSVHSKTISNWPTYAYHPATSDQRVEPLKQTVEPMKHKGKGSIEASITKLATGVAEALVAEIMRSVTTTLTARLETEMKALLPATPANTPDPLPSIDSVIKRLTATPAVVEKPHKPKVLICGLLPQQAGLIKQEFDDCYDLRFWKDETIGQLKVLAKQADVVYTFTSKIGHNVTDVLRNEHIKINHITGGLTSLKDALVKEYVARSDADHC